MSKKTIANKILSRLNSPRTTTVTLRGELLDGLSVNIKHTLSFEEAMALIAELIDNSIDEQNGIYAPESFEIVKALSIMKYYASIPTPKSPHQAYRLVYETDLLEQLTPHINQKQLVHLISAAEKQIEFHIQKMLSSIEVEAQGLLERVEEVVQAAETYVGIPHDEKTMSASSSNRCLGGTGTVIPFPRR